MRPRALHAARFARHDGHINVTPLIDVVMVLIIFYLIVGKLATDRLAPVRLPESSLGSAEAGAVLAITVTPGGAGAPVLLVENKTYSVDDAARLIAERRARQPDLAVQIRADRGLSFAQVAPALDACRAAGLTSVRLVTQRAGGSP